MKLWDHPNDVGSERLCGGRCYCHDKGRSFALMSRITNGAPAANDLPIARQSFQPIQAIQAVSSHTQGVRELHGTCWAIASAGELSCIPLYSRLILTGLQLASSRRPSTRPPNLKANTS